MPVQIPRLAKIMGADVTQADAASVAALVAAKIPEDTDLDYKQANDLTGDDNKEELAKDVTGMGNSRGGLLVIGIEQDAQACAKNATPVPISDAITTQMEQILRARVVPWLADVTIRPVPLTGTPGTGFYLIATPRSPLAPHAVRTQGPSKPRYAYAHRAGTTTRWLEETEIADAYRNRFRLAEEHTAQAQRLFDENPIPRPDKIGAEAAWIELALVPAVPAERRLDTGFINAVRAFLTDWAATSPAPALASGGQLTVARRRVHIGTGKTFLDLHTNGSAFIRACVSVWRPSAYAAPAPLPMWAVTLEHMTLGAIDLAARYALWAGGYGDADILARTNGIPTVALELGATNISSRGQNVVTRSSTTPTQITAPLDAITSDPCQLLLTSYSMAADLLADYGQDRTRLLSPDTIAYGLAPDAYGFKTWGINSGLSN
jgi:hypothetical protein